MTRSAAELTCPCGFKVRIEAGPDAFTNARRSAEQGMAAHAQRCPRSKLTFNRGKAKALLNELWEAAAKPHWIGAPGQHTHVRITLDRLAACFEPLKD